MDEVHARVRCRNLKERDHLGNLDVDRKNIQMDLMFKALCIVIIF
jgi:hypothetical protein